MGCHFLLQGIFLTHGSNLHLLCLLTMAGGFFTTEPPRKPLVAASGDYSSLQCKGFSMQWLLLLQIMDSRHTVSAVVAHGLSCPKTCGIFSDQFEPRSSALTGGFLTTRPPGESPKTAFLRSSSGGSDADCLGTHTLRNSELRCSG